MENNTYKYTIIIPHYNSEIGLEKLLRSIPDEDHIEVIVVDDRSPSEQFKEIIKKSGLANISSYINNGIKGAGTCRNIGLDKALGNFLVFADSDDFFTENSFQKIDDFLSSSSASTDIIYFNVTSKNASGEVGYRHIKNSNLVLSFINKANKYYEEKIRLTHNVPWGKVFRASFVKDNNIKFDEVIVSNDVMFSVKAGNLAKDIGCSSEVIYCVTQSDGTLTTKKSVDNLWVRLEVYTRYYHYLTEKEKKKIGASPLPLLLQSLRYSPLQMFKAIYFFKKSKVNIFKYLILDKSKVARVSKEYLAKLKV